MIVSAIAAVAKNGVIGSKGDLPWNLPDDMKYFQRTTMDHHVITGRKNYESIPEKYRPLKGRPNVVITRNPHYQAPGATVLASLEAALDHARSSGEEEVFIIGGGRVYAEASAKDLVDRWYITEVLANVEGDTYLPTVDMERFKEVSSVHHQQDERHEMAFRFVVLERIR